ncbi:hypothetical protein LC065_07750 [Halobacillus litoralis]|uniref:hypothetical protein n=1 Tax=Halobacillus litoralis TaxID=45668 RepID=UPI001CFF03FA|nr:hypothetical protein [Halobacillus litoralis]WLR49043.1 hypothetical protein LC065_07750 [Halobacillus litoralis]
MEEEKQLTNSAIKTIRHNKYQAPEWNINLSEKEIHKAIDQRKRRNSSAQRI